MDWFMISIGLSFLSFFLIVLLFVFWNLYKKTDLKHEALAKGMSIYAKHHEDDQNESLRIIKELKSANLLWEEKSMELLYLLKGFDSFDSLLEEAKNQKDNMHSLNYVCLQKKNIE